MDWHRLLVTITPLSLAFAHAAAAQTDFSGRGVVAPDTARGGRGAVASAGSGWGSSITVTQDAERLVVEVPFFSRYDMQPPIRFAYALNGGETKNTVMVGNGMREQTARATWNGATFVITTTQVTPNPAGAGDPLRIEVVQRLSLESPNRLVVETTRPGVLGGSSSTTRTVYTKQ
jgi:hypothetical protein